MMWFCYKCLVSHDYLGVFDSFKQLDEVVCVLFMVQRVSDIESV